MESYSLVRGVVFRPESFGGLLFVPHRALIIELNHMAYQVIEAIGSGGTEKEVLTALGSDYQCQINGFLLRLEQSGIIRRGDANE